MEPRPPNISGSPTTAPNLPTARLATPSSAAVAPPMESNRKFMFNNSWFSFSGNGHFVRPPVAAAKHTRSRSGMGGKVWMRAPH